MGVADKIEQEIKQWIQEAVEPKDKALLMILFQMNSNLTENTTITKAVAKDFSEHKHKVDGILNRIKGGWFVLGCALLAVQALGMWIVNTQMNNLAREATRNETQEVQLARIQAEATNMAYRLQVLEQQINAFPR